MFSKLLRDQSGRMVEPLLFVAILGMAAAIVIPQLSARREAREQILSAQCIKNLFLIKEGGDPSAFVCPISDLAYTSETRDGDRVLSCPDPRNHLRFDLSLVQRGESWELHSGLPDTRPTPNGVVEIDGARTFFEYQPEEVTIVNPPPPALTRYLFIPLIVGFLFLVFLMPAKWLGSVLLSEYSENTLGQSLLLFVARSVPGFRRRPLQSSCHLPRTGADATPNAFQIVWIQLGGLFPIESTLCP